MVQTEARVSRLQYFSQQQSFSLGKMNFALSSAHRSSNFRPEKSSHVTKVSYDLIYLQFYLRQVYNHTVASTWPHLVHNETVSGDSYLLRDMLLTQPQMDAEDRFSSIAPIHRSSAFTIKIKRFVGVFKLSRL